MRSLFWVSPLNGIFMSSKTSFPFSVNSALSGWHQMATAIWEITTGRGRTQPVCFCGLLLGVRIIFSKDVYAHEFKEKPSRHSHSTGCLMSVYSLSTFNISLVAWLHSLGLRFGERPLTTFLSCSPAGPLVPSLIALLRLCSSCSHSPEFLHPKWVLLCESFHIVPPKLNHLPSVLAAAGL